MRPLAAFLAFLVWGFQTPQNTGSKMTSADLVEHVKRRDWDLVMRPGLVDKNAAPALLPLLDDPDSQVRELTLACLNATGGPVAVEGFFKALHDRIDTVRAAAVRYLAAHYRTTDIPAIEKELRSSPDPYVRERLALILGRTDSGTELPVLQLGFARERDEHAKHAMSLALARLGDPAQLQAVVSRLGQDDPYERVAALQDLPYVNNPSVLKWVIPLLDDTRPGWNVGPSYRALYIRVCDVAVNVVNEMLGRRFYWVEPRKRYSPEEIAQIRKILASIG
jgi:HEAT repeats